jgi:hypothetical protein
MFTKLFKTKNNLALVPKKIKAKKSFFTKAISNSC